MICDFCSDPAPCYRYPCRTFDFGPTTSVEDWAACHTCSSLIEAGYRVTLAWRSNNSCLCDIDYTPMLRQLHDDFFDHRCGPRELIGR